MLEAPTPTLRAQGETAFFFDVVNNPDIFYIYRGTSAPVQTERKPVFHAHLGYYMGRDLQHVEIILLKQKRNRRESHLTWSGGDMQARYTTSIPVSLAMGSDGVLTITPQQDLSPGEYLLSLGRQMMQYDFSVR